MNTRSQSYHGIKVLSLLKNLLKDTTLTQKRRVKDISKNEVVT